MSSLVNFSNFEQVQTVPAAAAAAAAPGFQIDADVRVIEPDVQVIEPDVQVLFTIGAPPAAMRAQVQPSRRRLRISVRASGRAPSRAMRATDRLSHQTPVQANDLTQQHACVICMCNADNIIDVCNNLGHYLCTECLNNGITECPVCRRIFHAPENISLYGNEDNAKKTRAIRAQRAREVIDDSSNHMWQLYFDGAGAGAGAGASASYEDDYEDEYSSYTESSYGEYVAHDDEDNDGSGIV